MADEEKTIDDIEPANVRRVLLPLVLTGGGLLLLVLLLVVSFSPIALGRPDRVSIIGDVVLICLGLIPVMICLFPLYLLLMAGIYWTNRLEQGGRAGLQKAHDATQRMAQTTNERTTALNQRSINWATRFSHLGTFFYKSRTEGEKTDE
jgi:hypothetical protein